MSSATTMKSSAVGAARLLRASPPPLPTWPWESQIYGTHRLPSYQPPAYAPLGLLRSPLRHRSRPRPMLSCAPPCLPRPPSRPDPAQGHRIQAGRGGESRIRGHLRWSSHLPPHCQLLLFLPCAGVRVCLRGFTLPPPSQHVDAGGLNLGRWAAAPRLLGGGVEEKNRGASDEALGQASPCC